MCSPKHESDNFTLELSSHMFNEPENVIKNTIYHELCHYIQMKEQLRDGIIYFDPRSGRLMWSGYYRNDSYEKPHGGR